MAEAWYKKWFSTGEYLELYKHRNSADAKKIAGLIVKTLKLPKGANILDVACGNGRHSLVFASKGYNVTGIDLSNYLINEAKSKLGSSYKKFAGRLKFEISDMRYIKHKDKFDLAVNLFSSFGYLEKDSENFKTFNSISKSLKTGGYFFFDFLNPVYLKKRLVNYDIKEGNDKIIIQVRNISNETVHKDIIIIKNNLEGKLPKLVKFSEMIKLYSADRFKKELAKAGLKAVKMFGDYSGKKYDPNSSERLIILSRKIH